MTFNIDSNWLGTRSGDENLVYGYSTPAWYTNTDTADPLFTDAANGDFTLGVGSPAIEAGLYSVDTLAALNTATMYTEPRDYLGQIRGNSFDQGAIEYAYDGEADTTSPVVEIFTQAQTVQCDSVSIAWTDGDNVGVTSRKWRVGSAPDATHGTEATSPATVTGMSIGSNNIYIGAGDAAANWGSDSVVIAYTGICREEAVTGGYKITGADGQFSKTGASIISR